MKFKTLLLSILFLIIAASNAFAIVSGVIEWSDGSTSSKTIDYGDSLSYRVVSGSSEPAYLRKIILNEQVDGSFLKLKDLYVKQETQYINQIKDITSENYERAGTYEIELYLLDEDNSFLESIQFTVNKVPPVFNGHIPAIVIQEDSDYIIDLADYFTDKEIHDVLEYTYSLSNPELIKITHDQSKFTLTNKIKDWSGNAGKITFYADDDGSGPRAKVQSNEVSIIVNPVNDKPVITSSPITTAVQDQLYQYDVNAEDVDSLLLTYSLLSKPEGMTISQTGLIKWLPGNDDVGNHVITVKVSDSQDFTTQTYVLNVENVNDDPYFVSTPLLTAAQGQLYIYTAEAHDIDSDDILTYSLTTNPNGMTIKKIDNNHAKIEWLPANNNVGDYTVEIKVKDNSGSYALQKYTLYVNDVNEQPVIESFYPLSDPRIYEGESQNFNVKAHDPDGDIPKYEWYFDNNKQSSSLNSFTYNSDYNSQGTHKVKVIVSDNEFSVEKEWTLTIFNINRLPDGVILYPESDIAITQGQSISFQSDGYDPDNDQIRYSWYFNGITQNDNCINQEDLNLLKSLFGNPSRYRKEADIVLDGIIDLRDAVSFIFYAGTGEICSTDSKYNAKYDLTSNVPQSTIKSNAQNPTITFNEIGTYEVELYIYDSYDYSDTTPATVTVTVQAYVNQPPVLDEINNKQVKENQLVEFRVSASDPEGDPLTFSASELPEGAVFEIKQGFPTFSWIPGYGQSGEYEITFYVHDNHNNMDSEKIKINVLKEDRSPVITSKPITTFVTDYDFTKEYRYDVNAYDPDNDPLTYSLLSKPEGMTINPQTGLIKWIPSRRQLGFNNVAVQVSDGTYTATQSFTVNVIVEKVKLAREKIYISTLQIVNEELIPGDVMLTNIVFSNEDNYDMDARVTVAIPELGVRKKNKFNLDSNEQASSIIPLDIPEYAEPGEYAVMVTIYDGEISRTKYRFVNII